MSQVPCSKAAGRCASQVPPAAATQVPYRSLGTGCAAAAVDGYNILTVCRCIIRYRTAPQVRTGIRGCMPQRGPRSGAGRRPRRGPAASKGGSRSIGFAPRAAGADRSAARLALFTGTSTHWCTVRCKTTLNDESGHDHKGSLDVWHGPSEFQRFCSKNLSRPCPWGRVARARYQPGGPPNLEEWEAFAVQQGAAPPPAAPRKPPTLQG